MAIIPQKSLFGWKEVEKSSDLNRLVLILDLLNDEKFMVFLEKMRKGRRDDYPIRAVWNSVLAGIVYQHESIASLRRELLRNGELRQICGFDPVKGSEAVPPAWVYSRFFKKLLDNADEIDRMFHASVEKLKEHLPDLGEHLSVDGKAVESYAKRKKDPSESSDPDADWGVKTYRREKPDGKVWEKITSWFGYKLHLVVDADYEIPLGYEVTKASVHDSGMLLPLVEELKEKHPEIAERAAYCACDKGYDSAENNRALYDDYGIKPVIDIRRMWKEEKTSEIKTRPLFEDRADNIVYDRSGRVYCHMSDPIREGETRMEMAFAGFEKDRKALKYRCPAAAYGIECARRKTCGGGGYSKHGRSIRVPLDKDRRLFTPLARSTYKFEEMKKKRSAVERVNSRIDQVYGFERHFIRRQAKMRLRVSLALTVMVAMAAGRMEQKERENIRSLVKPARSPA